MSEDLPDLRRAAGVLFDLDGVLTPTAEVHMRAWQAVFDEVLTRWGVTEPYTDVDYFAYVDGKKRYDGVASLLRSRNVEIPWGEVTDPPEAETICGVGNRKNAAFAAALRSEGIAPYPGSLALLRSLQEQGTPMAVVSSSRNAPAVLDAAGVAGYFRTVVSGAVASDLGLAGKPAPDTFLHAAEVLGASPDRAVVLEDAVSGVAAGQAGRFGLVVGVESDAVSVRDARFNLRDMPHVSIERGAVENVLDEIRFGRGDTRLHHADLVVLDPPRTGAGPDVVKRIAELAGRLQVHRVALVDDVEGPAGQHDLEAERAQGVDRRGDLLVVLDEALLEVGGIRKQAVRHAQGRQQRGGLALARGRRLAAPGDE